MKKTLSLLLIAVALVSCSRDPNVVKQRYLVQGNKYFHRGKYKEASIMYRNALQKDQKFGAAHYHLALSELKLQKYPTAVAALRRALELLPANSQEQRDASVKLADLYLSATREKQFMDDVENIANTLLKNDPNSFEGHRILGEVSFAMAQEMYRKGLRDRARQLAEKARAEFSTADGIKPDDPSILLALARSDAGEGKFPEAEAHYRRVIAKDAHNTSNYGEFYRLYLVQNKATEAEQLLREGIRNNLKDYSLMTILAAHYYSLQRRGDMVKVLEEMKTRARDFPQAYLTVGDFYLRLGEMDEAVRQYEAGIQNDAKQKVAYQKRIVETRMRQGKREEALSVGEQILKDNPKDSDITALKASLLVDQGDVQKAIADLQKVVNGSPENFIARFNLGRAHQAKGQYEQAKQQYIEAVRVRADYMPARTALGQLQIAQGEYEGALKTAADMLQADRQNVQARLMQAAALRGQGKAEEARTILDSLLKQNPNFSEAAFQLAMLDLQQKRYREAEQNFRRTRQLEPNDTRGALGVAEAYMAEQRMDQAIQYIQGELKKSDLPELHQAVGNAAARSGKLDLALAEFKQAIAMFQSRGRVPANAYVLMGETYRIKGDFQSAIATMQKARETAPENPMVLHTLAVSLDAANRKQEARQTYEELLRVDPNNAVALNNLAYAIVESGGDLNQALTYAQRAKQRFPQLAEISDTLGWIYLKKNMSDSAIDIFRDLVNKQPNRATYRYHLAMALTQKGETRQALKELEAALRQNPSREEAGKIRELISKIG